MRMTAVRRSRFLILPLLLPTLLSLSCASFQVQVPVTSDPSHTAPTPATDYSPRKTTVSFLWGLLNDQVIEPDCTDCGVQNLVVERDVFETIVTIATLGLVSPTGVKWICQEPAPQEGELPSSPKPRKKAKKRGTVDAH
jgi:hypothetical protein